MEELAPDLGLEWWKAGHADKQFWLARVEIYSVGRVAVETFTSTCNLSLERVFALTFDFGPAELETLLGLISPELAAPLRTHMTGRFREPEIVEIRGLLVDMTAHLGEPQANNDETYVPLVVEAFSAPSGHEHQHPGALTDAPTAEELPRKSIARIPASGTGNRTPAGSRSSFPQLRVTSRSPQGASGYSETRSPRGATIVVMIDRKNFVYGSESGANCRRVALWWRSATIHDDPSGEELQRVEPGPGVYAIEGFHDGGMGPGILYIGSSGVRSANRTLLERLGESMNRVWWKENNRYHLFSDVWNVRVRWATIKPEAGEDQKTATDANLLIDQVEKLLIVAHAPPFNSQGVRTATFDELGSLMVLNGGQKGPLLPVIYGSYYCPDEWPASPSTRLSASPE
jgi:hypothetical protein